MDGLIDTILNGLFDVIYNVMQLVLDSFVGRLLYYAETGLCKIVGMLDQMFKIFAGIDQVSYNGDKDYLINIFFNNRSINNVYWGMALIGIAMMFGFTIAAVVRKMFDASGRMQTSLGQIITAAIRSMFLILGMSAIMVIVLNSTNVLMEQINYIFNDPGNLDLEETIVYTDEDYAAMGRVLNTIGNYSLNPSYSSRYNINTCFNEIRSDLYYLQGRNVFRYYYATVDADGNTVNTWQSVLQKIANSHDLRSDLKLDLNYDAVTTAMVTAMDVIRNDASFRPLESYTRVMPAEGMLPLDRYLFLMGTMHAAKNNIYNEKAELTDPVRGPYYSGEKNIYNISQVSSDFDVGFATDYLVVFIAAIALIFDLITIILNCIARMFNMLFLYLIAPPIFATQPFDGGGKTKQWLTAFIVQAFSVFGTVIAMRLLLVLLPIVTSSELVLFQNSMLNTMSKLVLIYGLFEVSKKATGLLTGILADSAGWQSVQAGDMSGSAGKLIGGVTGAAKAVGGAALKATGKVADVATKPLQNVAKRGYDTTIGKAANAWNNLGKGDVEGQKAMTAAKERLATEQAYAKLTGKSGGDAGGPAGGGPSESSGGPSLPGSQSDAGGGNPDLPGKQSGGPDGGGANIPKAPPPPPPPGSPAAELAAKADKMHAAMSNKVDAQGNMRSPSRAPGSAAPPAGGAGGEQTSRRMGGGFTSQGNREVGGIGNRPTLGDKPEPAAAPRRSKEAPTVPSKRMTLDD
ncbi:MAG: hypothetical protein IJV43_00440 [Oscillospiraceae bacterium]|nr:hypothetical protein [Oscillospiraceae bacterium]